MFFCMFFIYRFHLSQLVMDPVVIVSGNWIKKNGYVFNIDRRGCRVLHLDEKTTHEDFAKTVLDDYGMNDLRDHIQLSYMFSNIALKTMAHDTPPVYVSNIRQLQGFLSLNIIEQLRLCVEITKNRAREKSKTFFSFSSEIEASVVESKDEKSQWELQWLQFGEGTRGQ